MRGLGKYLCNILKVNLIYKVVNNIKEKYVSRLNCDKFQRYVHKHGSKFYMHSLDLFINILLEHVEICDFKLNVKQNVRRI